jgi:hypothetical protein
MPVKLRSAALEYRVRRKLPVHILIPTIRVRVPRHRHSLDFPRRFTAVVVVNTLPDASVALKSSRLVLGQMSLPL